MWSALRSDFAEFVSTVTEDTSNVLSKLDAGMDRNDDDDDAAGTDEGTPQKREVNHAELKEIMKLLREHPGTYTEDLAGEDDKEAVEEFLKNFNIDDKTDEIAEVLKEHEDTVKALFEELCPTEVSYEEFWKRYFYRCDENRIATQLQEETERARKARAEAIEGGIKTVTNFFGGAVMAVANTIAPESEPGDTPASDRGLNFFGAKGRPPFVMNTAVSESDNEEEEEEELGWDDEDEDDLEVDDNEGSRNESQPEQIEFTDKVSEDLREQLKQAVEERDQIQQTVHMQANEIKLLQNKLSDNPSKDIESEEIEQLKLKLFEKEAELAALKAKVDDDGMDEGVNKLDCLARMIGNLPASEMEKLKTQVFGINGNSSNDELAEKASALEQKVQALSEVIKTKDASLSVANEKLAATTQELKASRSQLSSVSANAQSTGDAIKNLEDNVKAARQGLEASQAENAQLKQNAQLAQESSAAEISALQQDLAASQASVASLTNEVADVAQKLKASEDALSASQIQVAALTKQLNEAAQKLRASEDALQKKEAELAAVSTGTTSAASPPKAFSSAVKAATPASLVTPAASLSATKLETEDDNNEADDWGDDWD